MPSAAAEAIALIVLIAVLAFAIIRPKDLPEAVAAVPGALLLLVTGSIAAQDAWTHVAEMLPTIIFLAAVLMLSHLCEEEGLFAAAGDLMARQSRGKPTRLLALVFVVASLVTAVLSLDATVVLLTPVVFATASRLGMRPTPHVYATSHLANSASLLLPVSNLTNLLALSAAGVGFVTFAGLMAVPWLVAIAIEFVVFRWFFSSDLSVSAAAQDDHEPVPVPVFALVVLGLTLAGFVVSSAVHLEPFWAALAGVVVLTVKRLVARPRQALTEGRELGAAANVWFLLFVLSLSVIVATVVEHGVSGAMRSIVPTHADLPSLLLLAGIAAILANLVNNLPAVLVMLPLVADTGPVAVMAVLIGVNVGPNLTYVGSLATLLWRRILADHDETAEIVPFTKLGLLTVPATLVLSTTALWGVAQLMGV